MLRIIALPVLFFFLYSVNASGSHKYINYFEHLTYDRFHIKEQHERVRRSTRSGGSGPSHVSLKFQSHGGHFNIRLVQDNSIFHDDLELVDGNGNPLESDVSHIYHGTIYGKKNSLVHGSIVDGVFTGRIKDPDRGTYYVEHADSFLKGKPFIMRKPGHSVIYHEKDIDYPHEHGSHKTCGSSFSDIEKRMKETQKSAVMEDEDHTHLRKKRAVNADKNTCLLFLRTDHMLWAEMQSRERIIGKISEHVKALNEMYQSTHFDTPDGTRIRNIGFMVKRMMINEETNPKDPFYSKNIGVEKFLDLASSENHNQFCLAYVFTQRDFDNGVLGLAWVGGVGSSGGICDEYRQYEGKAGKSLNTGIVTFENYGSTVPSRVSYITFAHEVGHNFGSPHDSGKECTPGESSSLFKSVGNYVMFASATSGQKENNRLFSSCSIGNMSRVLEAKKDRCFVEADRPICGNAIIDEGEQCDCGYSDQCAEVNDANCCYSADDKDNGCKLKPDAKCSITQGPCCDPNTCVFKPRTEQCSPDAECQEAQVCDSTSATCPPARPKENRTVECNYGTQVCWAGECSGSICQKYGMEDCSCAIPDNGDTSIACEVCCKPPGVDGECKSTGSLDFFNGTTIHLQPGSPCDDFKGYCDMFSKCRKVDADGPLSRIKKAILNPELYRTIKEWIVQYWWAVALMCLALIMLMAGFIKLCSVHTPSNNPRLPKHRQLPGANTLRRRRAAQQQRRQGGYQHQMRDMGRRH